MICIPISWGGFDTSGIINIYCNSNVYVSNKTKEYGQYYSYLNSGFRFCGMFTAYKESEQTYVYRLAGSGLGTIYYYASEQSSTSNTYNVSGLTQINIKSYYTSLIGWRFEISSIDYLDSNGDFRHVTF